MVPELIHNQLEILFLLCELVRFQDHQLQLKKSGTGVPNPPYGKKQI